MFLGKGRVFVGLNIGLEVSWRGEKAEYVDPSLRGPNENARLCVVDADRGQGRGEGDVEKEVAGGNAVDLAGLVVRCSENPAVSANVDGVDREFVVAPSSKRPGFAGSLGGLT